MSSETQTKTPIPIPTIFNCRLIAPGLLQFTPLTCCKCHSIMPDTEWRCNHCGHDHEYMGDDRREEKYVYIMESTSTSQAAKVKGDETKKTWRDAIRKVLLGIIGRGRGRNVAFKKDKKKEEKKKEEEEEEDIAEGDKNKNEEIEKKKKKKKEKNKKKNKKGQEGVVFSSDDTYNTLDYDENGNWVVLAGEQQLVRTQVEVDGAGQQVSGYHEQQHGEGKEKKEKEKEKEKEKKKKGKEKKEEKEVTDGETHAQLEQRGRKDEQQQQQQQQQEQQQEEEEEQEIQSSPGLFVSLVQKARIYRT